MTEPESGAVSPARTRPPQLALSGHVGAERAAELCARVQSTAGACPDDPLHCEVERLEDPDIATVEVLAWMALAARRLGRGLELDGARHDLRGLIALAGLGDVLRCRDDVRDPSVE